jgi:hypothetical protein
MSLLLRSGKPLVQDVAFGFGVTQQEVSRLEGLGSGLQPRPSG